MDTKTLVNPLPESVRLVLSDGTERVIGPWGVAIVPRQASDGRAVQVLVAELVASSSTLRREAM